MKKYSVNVDGTTYEVEIELISEGDIGQTVPKSAAPKAEAPAPAAKAAPAPKAAPAAAAAPAASGGSDLEVKSPMPGNIWEIKVSEGQSIKLGDVLVVLEAMKMENEIVSPKDGIVTTIAVNKGDAVASQQLICVVR